MALNRQILQKSRPVGMPQHSNFDIVDAAPPDPADEVLPKIYFYPSIRICGERGPVVSAVQKKLLVIGAGLPTQRT
jgi:hypothetical protein